MEQLVSTITDLVHKFGYYGIFIMTFLESTFVPIPAEITMIPAGYLISKGEMNFFIVLILSILGTVGGALFNYWLAYHYGRKIISKYGKYIFFPEHKMSKIETYFNAHGPISTFLGRLIPGLRHYISFPAGLGKMDLKAFSIYTALGGSIWLLVLLTLGYLIGENEDKIKEYILWVKGGVLIFVVVIVTFYLWKMGNNKRKNGNKQNQ